MTRRKRSALRQDLTDLAAVVALLIVFLSDRRRRHGHNRPNPEGFATTTKG